MKCSAWHIWKITEFNGYVNEARRHKDQENSTNYSYKTCQNIIKIFISQRDTNNVFGVGKQQTVLAVTVQVNSVKHADKNEWDAKSCAVKKSKEMGDLQTLLTNRIKRKWRHLLMNNK